METSIPSDKLSFLHKLLDKELEGLKESSLSNSHLRSADGLSSASQQYPVRREQQFVSPPENHHQSGQSRHSRNLSNNNRSAYDEDESRYSQQQQYDVMHGGGGNSIGGMSNNNNKVPNKSAQMNMDLQDLQSKISQLEKKIVGINQNKNNSYSNCQFDDKENSMLFNQSNDVSVSHIHSKDAIEMSFQKNKQRLNTYDSEEDSQEQLQQQGQGLCLVNGSFVEDKNVLENRNVVVYRTQQAKKFQQVEELESEETPLKQKYTKGQVTEPVDNHTSTKPKKKSGFPGSHHHSSSTNNLRSTSSGMRGSETPTGSSAKLRANKFSIERKIQEAESVLDNSRTSMKRSASRKGSMGSLHVGGSSSAQTRNNTSQTRLQQQQQLSRENSVNNNVRALEQVVANHNEVTVLNKKIMQIKKSQEADRQLLIKERLKNNELTELVDKLNRKIKRMTNQIEKSTSAEEDYKKLMESFEKSEFIRLQQKQLIAQLKQEVSSMRKPTGSQSSNNPSPRHADYSSVGGNHTSGGDIKKKKPKLKVNYAQ